MWEVLSLGEQEDSEDADEDHEFTMSPYEMLPAGPEYSHYMGSLTTPPCTEVRANITPFLGFVTACSYLYT